MNKKMFLLVLMCIKLSVIQVSASCSGSRITLLGLRWEYYSFSDNHYSDEPSVENINHFLYTTELNHQFIDRSRILYDVDVVHINNNTVDETLKAMKKYENVINLNVRDYYHYNYETLLKQGLVFAGDHKNNWGINEIFSEREHVKLDMKCLQRNGSNCDVIDVLRDTQNNVKLIQESVINIDSGVIYDLVMKMGVENPISRYNGRHLPSMYFDSYPSVSIAAPITCEGCLENHCQWNLVLVCLDHHIQYNELRTHYSKLQLPFKIVYDKTDCSAALRKYTHKLLAVVTPRPFNFDYESQVPVLFYQSSYIPAEENAFPNSLGLMKFDNLKYAFLWFLQQMDWRKVGVLSDSSIHSHEFEEALTDLFRHNNIMYRIIGCELHNCELWNISQAVHTFEKDGVGIIIANIDPKYISQIPTTQREFTWLLRELDWKSSKTWPQALKATNKAFSISLGPSPTPEIKKLFPADHGQNPLIKISHSINIIKRSYEKIMKQRDIKKKNRGQFYRTLMDHIKMDENIEVSNAYIVDNTQKLISIMNITEGKVDVIEFKKPERRTMDVLICAVRSNNYYRPCDEEVVLQIMFVVVIFSLTLLLITIYFHKTSPVHVSRYVHL